MLQASQTNTRTKRKYIYVFMVITHTLCSTTLSHTLCLSLSHVYFHFATKYMYLSVSPCILVLYIRSKFIKFLPLWHCHWYEPHANTTPSYIEILQNFLFFSWSFEQSSIIVSERMQQKVIVLNTRHRPTTKSNRLTIVIYFIADTLNSTHRFPKSV